MQDFETTADESNAEDEKECFGERSSQVTKNLIKRFILLISFGPGVLGFLWLLGRIFKR